jgi:cytochrome c-type biogenesis protein
MTDPSILVAFVAGIASFLSPCVLPLVPGYLSYMSGYGASEADGSPRLTQTTPVALAFVAGFTAVFVALGASATLLGDFLRVNKTLFAQVGGVIVILMGLVFVGAIKIPWLYREARFHPSPGAGVWGSTLLGGAFAFGWSPCISPALTAVLTMAAGEGVSGPGRGALLLAVYSLGLGIPFIVAGIGISHLTGALAILRRHTRLINVVSGALLIAFGLLLLTGEMYQLSARLNPTT